MKVQCFMLNGIRQYLIIIILLIYYQFLLGLNIFLQDGILQQMVVEGLILKALLNRLNHHRRYMLNGREKLTIMFRLFIQMENG
jgi:hypothetical protein